LPDPFVRLSHSTFADEIVRFTSQSGEWRNEQERKFADELKRVLVRLDEECARKGGYAAQAIAYYEKYSTNTSRWPATYSVASPEFAAWMTPLGATTRVSTPAEFRARVERDIAHFKRIVAARSIAPE
jgi:hypothetical protein